MGSARVVAAVAGTACVWLRLLQFLACCLGAVRVWVVVCRLQ